MFHPEERAYITLSRVWAAADYAWWAIRLRARSGVSATGNDRTRDTEPFQRRHLASSPLRTRTYRGNNANAAASWHVRKRKRSDNVSAVAAPTDIAIEPVLWDKTVERHLSSGHVRW